MMWMLVVLDILNGSAIVLGEYRIKEECEAAARATLVTSLQNYTPKYIEVDCKPISFISPGHQ